MKKYVKFAAISVLASTMAACGSSSDSSDPSTSDTTESSTSTAGQQDDATTAGNSGTGTDTSGTGTDTDTDGTDTDTDGTDTNTDGTDTDTDGSSTSSGLTPSGTSTLGNPPTLADPFADAIPSPDPDDPFGTELEIDSEAATAGGAPTTPKNLRVELISNNWAEINWAPANDDGEVVEYRIYRSDGHVYKVGPDMTDTNSYATRELQKYWNTTSFIDCNYTRFIARVHECGTYGPRAGDEFTYSVTAVDNEGLESARSNEISIVYHLESNSPVPKYNDFYKNDKDTFAQDHDLSDTAYFLDKFNVVFEDEFTETELNSNYWNTGLTWGDAHFINNEMQYFVDTQDKPDFGYDPFKLTGDSLIIEAVKTPSDLAANLPEACDEPNPNGSKRCQFLSGALSSHDKFGLTYGYVESRMKVGGISGMLSSFYLYHRYSGEDKKLHAPEIDIIEYLGENPDGDEDAFQTYHFADAVDGTIRSAPTMSYKNPTGEKYAEDFHTFGVLWEPQLVIWYIDGKEIKRLSGPLIARQSMNIVTYLVAGSGWAPTPPDDDSVYPLQFEIDYIRAYQRPEYDGNGQYPD